MNWLKSIFSSASGRPDLTAAQIVAGIPVIANLLSAWGIFTPSAAQQITLRDAMLWGFGLIAGDALLRTGRNIADALKARAAPAHRNVTGSSGSEAKPKGS